MEHSRRVETRAVKEMLLAIDGSSEWMHAALAIDGEVCAACSRETVRGAEDLLELIAQLDIERANAARSAIHYVIAPHGPGSYTGLRTGIALAKGLAAGWGASVVAVPVLAARASQHIVEGENRWVTLKAAADQWYVACYRRYEGVLEEVDAVRSVNSAELNRSISSPITLEWKTGEENVAVELIRFFLEQRVVRTPLFVAGKWSEPLKPLYVNAVNARTMAERNALRVLLQQR